MGTVLCFLSVRIYVCLRLFPHLLTLTTSLTLMKLSIDDDFQVNLFVHNQISYQLEATRVIALSVQRIRFIYVLKNSIWFSMCLGSSWKKYMKNIIHRYNIHICIWKQIIHCDFVDVVFHYTVVVFSTSTDYRQELLAVVCSLNCAVLCTRALFVNLLKTIFKKYRVRVLCWKMIFFFFRNALMFSIKRPEFPLSHRTDWLSALFTVSSSSHLSVWMQTFT